MQNSKKVTNFKVIVSNAGGSITELSNAVVKVAPFSLFPIDKMSSNISSTLYVFFEDDVEGNVGKALENIYQNQNASVSIEYIDDNSKIIETFNFGRVHLKDARIGSFDRNGAPLGDFTGENVLVRASFRYTKLTRS